MDKQISGRTQMENKYIQKTKKLISQNPVLQGFFISLNVEPSSAYEYVRHAMNFLSYVNKPINEIGYDDFTCYLNKIKTTDEGNATSSSYRILVYSVLKKFCHYCYLSERIGQKYKTENEQIAQEESEIQAIISKKNKQIQSIKNEMKKLSDEKHELEKLF